MTIEQKINDYICTMNAKKCSIDNINEHMPPIELWHISLYDNFDNKSEINHIHNLIGETDTAECLTSGVRYIRETKKRLMENR